MTAASSHTRFVVSLQALSIEHQIVPYELVCSLIAYTKVHDPLYLSSSQTRMKEKQEQDEKMKAELLRQQKGRIEQARKEMTEARRAQVGYLWHSFICACRCICGVHSFVHAGVFVSSMFYVLVHMTKPPSVLFALLSLNYS